VNSLLEADHPDTQELEKEVVKELKAMWVKQDECVAQTRYPGGRAIYAFGVHHTSTGAEGSRLILTPKPNQRLDLESERYR